MLWMLRSGAGWKGLPRKLNREGKIRWRKGFADGTFAPQKRGDQVGKTKRGKGTNLMVLDDAQGRPLSIDTAWASEADRAADRYRGDAVRPGHADLRQGGRRRRVA
ncbi:MAG: hypothetical protein AAF589_05795 [Planctomycetota bacterium]